MWAFNKETKENILCSPDDIYIERKEVRGKGKVATVYNEHGGVLWEFPNEFTDEQIKESIKFANRAHSNGFEVGSHSRSKEVSNILKSLIEVEDPFSL